MKVPAVIQRTLDGAAGVRVRIGRLRDRKPDQEDVFEEDDYVNDHDQVPWRVASACFRCESTEHLLKLCFAMRRY